MKKSVHYHSQLGNAYQNNNKISSMPVEIAHTQYLETANVGALW